MVLTDSDGRRTLSPSDSPVLLVMTDRHLGNTVISLPVARALGAYFDGPVDVLVDERYAALAELALPGQRVRGAASRVKKRFGVAAELRWAGLFPASAARRYRAVFGFANSRRDAWLTRATLSPARVGFAGRRSWAYTVPISVTPGRHVYEHYSQLLRPIGQTYAPDWMELEAPAAAHREFERSCTAGFGRVPERLAVLHPGAGGETRRWPADRFAAVGDDLARRHGMSVAIIAAGHERPLAESVRQRMAHPSSAAVLSLSLPGLLALFNRATVLVSNESGPTHLASATRLPIVTLFGPTPEHIWRPVRQHRLLTLRGTACDPRCGRHRCAANFACWCTLKPEKVLDGVKRVLDGKPRSSEPPDPEADHSRS